MSARELRIAEAAVILGVSPDTVRRRAEAAGVTLRGESRSHTISAVDVADLAVDEAEQAGRAELGELGPASARNRLRGIVTRVVAGTVMAQVDVQAGPHRVVALISSEAAEELGLEVGSLVAATVKATNVGIESLQ